MIDREQAGREASPTGGVLDSQTVKAPFAEQRGYDGGKKIVGRKRHVTVDTDGRLLMVNLTTADVSDSAGAQLILDGIRKRWPWLEHLFADGAYDLPRRVHFYSVIKSQATIREVYRAMADTTDNLLPPLGIFPDQMAPVVRTTPRGHELTTKG